MVREPDRARTLLGPHVAVLAKDAFDLVSDDLRGFDVIIDAFSTAPAQAYRRLGLAAQFWVGHAPAGRGHAQDRRRLDQQRHQP